MQLKHQNCTRLPPRAPGLHVSTAVLSQTCPRGHEVCTQSRVLWHASPELPLHVPATNAEDSSNYVDFEEVSSLMPFPPLFLCTVLSVYLFIQHNFVVWIFTRPWELRQCKCSLQLLYERSPLEGCFHKKLLYCNTVSPIHLCVVSFCADTLDLNIFYHLLVHDNQKILSSCIKNDY